MKIVDEHESIVDIESKLTHCISCEQLIEALHNEVSLLRMCKSKNLNKTVKFVSKNKQNPKTNLKNNFKYMCSTLLSSHQGDFIIPE
mgnify:CR=1 FL=1